MQNQLIIEFFRRGFIPPDNVYRGIKFENTICGEFRSSLLIESSVTTGRFSTFMKSGQFDNGKWTFNLKEPIIVKQNVDGQVCRIVFKQFDVYTGTMLPVDEFEQTGRWRLHIFERYSDHLEFPSLLSPCLFPPKTSVFQFQKGSINVGDAIRKAVREFFPNEHIRIMSPFDTI